MDKINQLRIGIVFNFRSGWLGGVYYILNIIKSLNHLDDKDKPELVVFYSEDLKEFINEINYPHIRLIQVEFMNIYKGYLLSWMTRKNTFVKKLTKQAQVDAIFPLWDFPIPSGPSPKIFSWYADFQHKFYPEFFSKRTYIARELRLKLMLKNASNLILSSNDSVSHLHKFYEVRRPMNIQVLQFVSNIDDISLVDFKELKIKYQLPDKYFLISNQFHKHKNHIVLLRALHLLKEKGLRYHFVITGKMESRGNNKYIESLTSYIEKGKLHDSISLLGVIPRQEQLSLMKYAQAVIQPSLFEGWSTVIEDARSLQVPVIASNLPVNIEQLQEQGTYFEPHDHLRLVEILDSFPERNHDKNIYEEYEVRMKKAAYKFIKIFNEN